jgi:hypothetical protein
MTMPAFLTKSATAATVAGLALALTGCTESRLRLSDDYGHAVRENIVAQVADPDAHYKGVPAPGSSGHRGDLAQQKYNHNAVTRPASTATSSAGSAGGGGGGGGPSN